MDAEQAGVHGALESERLGRALAHEMLADALAWIAQELRGGEHG
jgi:hypothetical protein